MFVDDKQKKNQKRNEKRKKNRAKKTQSANHEVISAKNRINNIRNVLSNEYGKPQKNKCEFIVSRNIIEILKACEPNNDTLPECYSLYDCVLINDISQLIDNTTNYIKIEEDNTMKLVIRNGNQIKNSKAKDASVVYKLCPESLSNWLKTKIWIVPNTVWYDKKGFGRGLKRRLSSILEIPESSGYGLNCYIKDLELMKLKKSISKTKVWVEENADKQEDIEEAFKKFLEDTTLDSGGFIGYDELKTYRSDKLKTKFNDLVSEHFNESVERGARQSQKRGFKGIKFLSI
tara:strand:- start:6800 stop:7666 length:867 start_codon:yes stop_codon:yes gene_type:complete